MAAYLDIDAIIAVAVEARPTFVDPSPAALTQCGGKVVARDHTSRVPDLTPSEPPLRGDRIELRPFNSNHASQAVAQRAGFTREGVLRAWQPIKNDQPDVVMWSRLVGDRHPTATIEGT